MVNNIFSMRRFFVGISARRGNIKKTRRCDCGAGIKAPGDCPSCLVRYLWNVGCLEQVK